MFYYFVIHYHVVFILIIISTKLIWQEAIRNLSYELFHEHKQLPDEELKKRLKAKLTGDEYCVNQLKKMNDEGVTYDELWNKKLYSAVSIFELFYQLTNSIY